MRKKIVSGREAVNRIEESLMSIEDLRKYNTELRERIAQLEQRVMELKIKAENCLDDLQLAQAPQASAAAGSPPSEDKTPQS